MSPTAIAWTEETWNPVTGCDRVSAGCDHCYAMTLAKRLKAMGQARYQNDGDPRTSGPGFAVTLQPDALDAPLRWRKPRRVFVDSMSDLFHPDIPVDFLRRVFDVMTEADQHTFQVLTKRPQRMASILREADAATSPKITSPPNVWLGTSVENQRYADLRIPHLLATPAAVRFLSVEPMLGPIDLGEWLGRCGDPTCPCQDGDVCHYVDDPATSTSAMERPRPVIDWVIIGGESGPGARPMQIEWAESLVAQCQAAGVAVFVKQLGTVTGGKHHHDIETFPESLRVREYPA